MWSILKIQSECLSQLDQVYIERKPFPRVKFHSAPLKNNSPYDFFFFCKDFEFRKKSKLDFFEENYVWKMIEQKRELNISRFQQQNLHKIIKVGIITSQEVAIIDRFCIEPMKNTSLAFSKLQPNIRSTCVGTSNICLVYLKPQKYPVYRVL